jgi:hypothetical protein
MFLFLYSLLTAIGTTAPPPHCYCPASVTVRVVDAARESVTYVYAVTNDSQYAVYGFVLGEANGEYELAVPPRECVLREEYCSCSLKAPSDWSACAHLQEQNEYIGLHFIAEKESAQLKPGATKEFQVVLPRRDPKYERTGFKTFAGPGCSFAGTIQTVSEQDR